MPLTDLPLEELQSFSPDVAEPADFDAFWSDTLEQSRASAQPPTLDRAETPITELIVEDLTFSGFGGDPVRAWVTRPKTDEPLPTVVEFLGYGGGRGLPGENPRWAATGYVHVVMDTRGQGAGWGSGGATPDPHGSEGAAPGVMTRGILDPATYYYRRMFTDGVRAVETARELPFVDADRTAVTGISQGGATSLAVAALVPGLAGVMPDVPFLCHFRRSVERTPQPPFTEIRQYLAIHRGVDEQVFRTLSYFDGVNFARRIQAPALFSVGLMDDIVLPSSVYAAYNHLAAVDRDIAVYPFNGHEGGETYQWLRQVQWLGKRGF